MDSYIGDILTGAGTDSRNAGFTQVSEEDALRYANYAQQMLQSKISRQKNSKAFMAKESQNIAANTPSYTIADNVYLNSRIHYIRYFPSTEEDRTFRNLLPISPHMPDLPTHGQPRFYERQGKTFYLFPYPETATGRLEFTYTRALDKLDLRRGQVNGTPSGAIIDLTVSGGPTSTVEARLTAGTYICLSAADGTVRLRNGLISSYNASNDELTLAANVSTYLVSGFALADLASTYMTIGKWTSTHSGLINEAERYISEYVTRRLFILDSSNDASDVLGELKEIEDDIVANYKSESRDIELIPTIDTEVMVYDYTMDL